MLAALMAAVQVTAAAGGISSGLGVIAAEGGEMIAPPVPRPVLHFTPEKNWTNDPNGLIWLDGEYHLFYQYNPQGDGWGHMSWGHAVSKDLLSWEHLPVAIPEGAGVMIFSGTAVFDRNNTSGFGAGGNAPLVAVYTGHEQAARLEHQNLAYSTDHGRIWTKYAGNPVINVGAADFRDPKVFWHAPSGRWVMVVSLAAEKRAMFYSSADLKAWTKMSEFGTEGRKDVPNWECPDLFELPVEGEKNATRWVLVINVGGNGPSGGSGCQYFVGRFDGTRFVNDNPAETVLWLDRGKDFYAFQSYQDAPGGKRLGLAWMANSHYAGATPTSPWRGAMTVPREFKLRKTAEGLRVTQMPIEGIGAKLRERGAKETVLGRMQIGADGAAIGAVGQVALIEAEFELGTAAKFGIRARESGSERTEVGYDVAAGEMYVDRAHSGRVDVHPMFAAVQRAPLAVGAERRVKLTIVVDQSSVEAFGGEGAATITSLVFPRSESDKFSLFAEGGEVKLIGLRVVAMETP